MPEKCHVIGCDHPCVANGLCQKHYMRVKRNGTIDETRPSDWGNREKHPAYRAWCGLRRYHLLEMADEWKNDFWVFANDVGVKPNKSQAKRPDSSIPWSKNNFYWKEKRTTSEDRKEYAREWHKKSQLANPNYYLDRSLRKKYGVGFEWYQETLLKQNGVCAICKQPEVAKIKGKVISMPIDHDHKTGKVRGLLCSKCNRGLGLFKDDIEILNSAIQYLKG